MTKIGKIFRETLVRNIQDEVKAKNNTFVMSYTKLSASKFGVLRKSLRLIGAQVHVSKNRVAKIALKELQQDKLADTLKGQTAFICSDSDAVSVSKALMDFTKTHKTVTIQGGLLEGALLEQADVSRLSELPSREVLLSQLMGTMLAPLTRLAGVLNGKTRDLLSILKQYSEKKGGS